MHNIKDLRDNSEVFKKKFLDRNYKFDLEKFKSLDQENRRLITEKEKLEQEKKLLSQSRDQSNFDKSKKISEKILKISQAQIISQN